MHVELGDDGARVVQAFDAFKRDVFALRELEQVLQALRYEYTQFMLERMEVTVP